ncbi:BBE domain-containing protein [Sphaerisporangium sp. NPDC051017]|uniref:BBE domain-containing protein n=1 Tax=Sphaerisporangium sp. NPDC051017 TaxID=3154636 RepID=UPI0034357B99
MPDTVKDPRFADFPATFKGRVLRAGESDFAHTRQIWNMLRRDETPALIVQAADRNLDAVMAEAPRELAIALILLNAPPLPGIPDAVVGTPIVAMLVIYTGDLAEYEAATAGLWSLARPLVTQVAESTWTHANSIADPFEPAGRPQYLRGGYMSRIDADLANVALEQLASCPRTTPPSVNCLITLPILGGAIFDHPEDATAFSRTGAEWLYEVSAHWDDPADDTAHLDWVHETDELLRRWATPNAYINLTTHRGAEWLPRAYGTDEKWRRLVALKEAWDPNNRFAYNKNILAAAQELGS